MIHKLKHIYYKLRYGIGCCDVADLDSYLAKIIAKGLKRFRLNNVSYPNDLTEKEWGEILDKMIYSFEHFDDRLATDNKTGKELLAFINTKNKRIQEGIDLFAKHYFSLWI